MKTIANKRCLPGWRLMVVVAIAALATAAHGQHPLYYSIDVDKGLPSNEVYQLVQDEFGYIWIGCDAGLFRYDGFTFKPYRSSVQNSRAISSLKLDGQSRIWCRNFSGQIFRVQSDSLRLMADMSGDSLVNNQYAIDAQDRAWVFRGRHLVQISDEGKELQRHKLPFESAVAIPQYIHYGNGELFVSLRASYAYRFGVEAGVFTRLVSNSPDFNKRLNSFFVWKDTVRVLSMMTQTRSFLISSIVGDRIESVHEYITTNQNSRVHELTTDREDNLWVCTTDGAFPFSPKFSYVDEHKGFFKSFRVSYVLKDREGLYWISTLQHGLLICPSLQVRGWNVANSGLKEDNLSCVTMHNGHVIAGSYTGSVAMINPATGGVQVLDDGSATINTKKIASEGNRIMVSHGPLTEFFPTGKPLHHPPYNLRDFALVRDSVFYVYPDQAGVAALADLRIVKTNSTRVLRPVGGRCVAYLPQEDAFYFSLNDGLFRYRREQWEEIFVDEKEIHAMNLSVSGNTLWAATLANGVLAIEQAKVVKRFGVENGFSEVEVKCIYADEPYVWASSSLHVYRINKVTGEVARVASTLGFNAADVNSITGGNDVVYFATNKGLVELPADLNWQNDVKPNLSIVSAQYANTELRMDTAVHLPYYNNNFRIEFSSVAFRSRGLFEYEYRLHGLDDGWATTPGAVPYVVYSSLPPGSYTFEVRAINETGVRGESRTLAFSVAPPVWQTWWFYLLSSLAMVMAVVVTYTLRINYLRTQASIANRLTASQLTALKAQMNPHFMYNALNSIQDLVTNKDVRNSNLYLSKFSSLMRKVLDASGADEISVQDELDILTLYLDLEKLRFGDEFRYEITTDSRIDTYRVLLPSMILQPFVENSVKHGLLHKKGSKLLTISFTLTDKLECVITDNGVGRKRSAEIKNRISEKHASFSTQAAEKRIELLTAYANKKFEFTIHDLESNGVASGTQVVVRIPLNDS